MPACIYLYTARHRQASSEAEVASCFQAPPPSVRQILGALEKRGRPERAPGRTHFLRVLSPVQEMPDLQTGKPAPRPAASISFEAAYLRIADGVAGTGWIEMGQDDFSHSMVRALDIGGMIWEGRSRYVSIDHLL